MMEPNNSIKLREKRDFGQIINATFSFWKENLKPLSKSIIMIVGPAILIGILFMVYFMSEFFTSIDFQNPNQNPQAVSESLNGIQFAYLIYFISIVLQISVVYNFIALYLTTNQQEITVQMVWEEVRKSFWRILFLMILVGLGVFIGFLLFIIPGIYLAVAFSFSMAVLTIEKTSVFKAISRSYNLIRGNWWSTFGLTFAIGVIVAVISYALLLPYYLVIVLIGFNLAEDPQTMFNATSPFMIISSVYLPLYTVAVTILYAIPMIAIAFKYFSIVEEQESVGLMEEVDNINSRPSGE